MIYIIRHGQTDMNSRRVLQGRSDLPLNSVGIAQARNAADRLRDISFSAVYSSPLMRAIQTAGIIAPEIPPMIDIRLIEMDYGAYEGADLDRLPPEFAAFLRDFTHTPPPEGMETLDMLISRAGAFMESVRGMTGNILISTHAVIMKGILEYLTPGSDGSYWSKHMGNCALYAADNGNGLIGIPAELGMDG